MKEVLPLCVRDHSELIQTNNKRKRKDKAKSWLSAEGFKGSPDSPVSCPTAATNNVAHEKLMCRATRTGELQKAEKTRRWCFPSAPCLLLPPLPPPPHPPASPVLRHPPPPSSLSTVLLSLVTKGGSPVSGLIWDTWTQTLIRHTATWHGQMRLPSFITPVLAWRESGANLQTDLSGCRMSAALQASHPRPDLCGLCVIRERRTETRPKPNQTQPHFGQKSLNPHICSSAFSISVTSKRTFLLLLTLFFCTFPDEDAKRLATQSKSV